MQKFLTGFACLLLSSTLAFGEGTKTWFQSRYEDFEKGTAKGVAVRSDGTLELSPALKQMATTQSTYIWRVVSDRDGNAFVAGGAPARVYKVTPQGQTAVIFEPQELQVQALLLGKDGAIYAATSPDGKVYRISRTGTASETPKANDKNAKPQSGDTAKASASEGTYSSSVYYDPQTKYIWDLVEDNDGRIYVATGDHGEIYRIDKTGAGSLFFKSDEAHIRALAIDPKGNLIAGSDGSGLIYRISPTGDAFILYSAPKKEITALAIDRDGNIYAAGAGDKRAPTFTGAMPIVSPIAPVVSTAVTSSGQPPLQPSPLTMTPIAPLTATGGSEIYRIAPDGSPKRIWQSRDELVYVMGFDQRSRLIAGTGNKGRLFVIGQDKFIDLGKATANQITGLAVAPNGGVYVAASNLGKLFLFGGSPDADGTYESDVFDAKIFSRWGRAAVRGTGNYELFARSGNVDNPDRNWSEWKKVDLSRELPMDVPPARFVQWRATLHPGTPSASIDSVLVNYLSKNVAPQVEDVYVQPGARFATSSRMNTLSEVTPIAVGPVSGSGNSSKYETSPSATRDRNSVAVRWSARDDNDDDLVYSVYYRGDNESRWKLLKDELTEKFYSFDSSLLPDGGYTVLVVASDAPSHTPEDALVDSAESARFEIDSTSPQVVNLAGAVENGVLHITFRALDGFSPIQRAEYSVDAGDWHVVEPVGQISDYRVENYDFNAPLPVNDTSTAAEPKQTDAPQPARVKVKKAEPGEEHVIVVRVYDRFENMGSSKTVLRGQ
jgi:two component regulator with propeller domain